MRHVYIVKLNSSNLFVKSGIVAAKKHFDETRSSIVHIKESTAHPVPVLGCEIVLAVNLIRGDGSIQKLVLEKWPIV